MKDNISLETFVLIAKAGIILGQANPSKNSEVLVETLVNQFTKQMLKHQVQAR